MSSCCFRKTVSWSFVTAWKSWINEHPQYSNSLRVCAQGLRVNQSTVPANKQHSIGLNTTASYKKLQEAPSLHHAVKHMYMFLFTFVMSLKCFIIPRDDSSASCPSCLSRESNCRLISLFHFEQMSDSGQLEGVWRDSYQRECLLNGTVSNTWTLDVHTVLSIDNKWFVHVLREEDNILD